MSDSGAAFGGLGLPPETVRDIDLAEMKAIDEAIALFVDIGQRPTTHLLMLREQIQAKLYRERGMTFWEVPSPAAAPVFEHAAAEPAPEKAVSRGPGRPRKPTDADRTPGS